MKRRILLAICAVLVGMLQTIAQVQMFNMKFEMPVPGKTYYLYNVGYRGFFCGGNLYSTQACLSKFHGWKVRVVPYTIDGQWDGLTILLQDSIEGGYRPNQFRNVFVEIEGNVFTDQADRTLTRDDIWHLSEFDRKRGTYYISLSEHNMVFTPENTPINLLGSDVNVNKKTPAVILCSKEQGVHTEWGFITEQEYNNNKEDYFKYMYSQDLKALIDSVHTLYPHVDTKKAMEVCNDTCTSSAEMLNQIGLMRAVLFSDGTKREEIPFTSILLNPNFDQGSYETWNMNYDNEAGTIYWQGGVELNPCAESWQTVFELNQDVKGIPNGVYRMDVQAFYRTRTPHVAWFNRDTAYVATEIFANDFSRPVHNQMLQTMKDINGEIDYLKINESLQQSYIIGKEHTFMNIDGSYVVDDLDATSLAFAHGYADQSLYFFVNDGAARIGIRQDRKRSGCWSAWDNFRLYYLGNDINSYIQALRHNTVIAKEMIRQTKLMGMDNSALRKAVSNAGKKAMNPDVEALKYNILNIQHEQNNLRQQWKDREFKEIKGIDGYDNYNLDSLHREKAIREKYLDLATETYRLASRTDESNIQLKIKLYEKAYNFWREDSLRNGYNISGLKFNIATDLGVLYHNNLQDYVNANAYFKCALQDAEERMKHHADNFHKDLYLAYSNVLVSCAMLKSWYQHDKYLENALNMYMTLYEEQSLYKEYAIELQNIKIWRLLVNGSVDEAMTLAQKTYAMDRLNDNSKMNLAECYNSKAYEYAKVSDFTNAWASIDKAISMIPDNANFYDSKGEILLMQGKNEEALKMWKKVLELKPNFLDDHPDATELSKGLKKLGLIE